MQRSGLRADGLGPHDPSVSPLSPCQDPSAIQGLGALVWGTSLRSTETREASVSPGGFSA